MSWFFKQKFLGIPQTAVTPAATWPQPSRGKRTSDCHSTWFLSTTTSGFTRSYRREHLKVALKLFSWCCKSLSQVTLELISRLPHQQITSWSTPRSCTFSPRSWRKTDLSFLSAPILSSLNTNSGLSSLSHKLDLVITPSNSRSREISQMELLGSIRVCIKTPRVKVFPSQHLILNQLMRGKELGRKNWILDLIIGKLSLVLMNLPSNPHSALNWWDPARVILLSLTCQRNRRLSIPLHQVGITDKRLHGWKLNLKILQ